MGLFINIKKSLRKIESIKISAIAALILLVIGVVLGRSVAEYRYHQTLGWIYQYGATISIFMIIGSLAVSFANTLSVIKEKRFDLKQKLFWGILSFLPILCMLILILI